ncbi:hypothetical protein B296_00001703, partial [Ensete ventricosum]
ETTVDSIFSISSYLCGKICLSCCLRDLPFLCQVSKKQYHCDGCGICRFGTREKVGTADR